MQSESGFEPRNYLPSNPPRGVAAGHYKFEQRYS